MKYKSYAPDGQVTYPDSPAIAWRWDGWLVVPTTTADPLALVLDELTGRDVEQRILSPVVLPPVEPPDVQVSLTASPEGLTARWRPTLLPDAVGYVVSLNERDPENPLLWTRQHGQVLAPATSSWTFKMLDEGRQAWLRVEIVNAVGGVLDVALEGTVTMPARAVRGPITLWSGDLTLGSVWKKLGGGTVTVSGTPGAQVLTFSAADTSVQQLVPTYPQSGRDYDLHAVLGCEAGDVGKTVQLYAHDTASGGQQFAQLVTLTSAALTPEGQTVRLQRPAGTSNGRFLRFGLGTSGGATVRRLTVHDLALGPKDFAYVRVTNRVYQQPLLVDSSNSAAGGSTFTGFYESTDRSVPAVTISTVNPLIFENFTTLATGEHFQTTVTNVQATLRRGFSRGRNPNLYKMAAGLFFRAAGLKRLLVEDWSFGQSGGLRLADSNIGPTDFITLRRIHTVNIDGRRSNGAGGYIRSALNGYSEVGGSGVDSSGRVIGKSLYQFLNLNNDNKSDAALPNVTVEDVYIENWPDECGGEDMFNFLKAGGTAASPITLNRICVWGNYPYDFQRGLLTPSDRYNFDAIQNIDATGSGPKASMTGALLQDSLTTSNWRKIGHHTRLRNSFFIGPGTLASIQAGTDHLIESSELLSSRKTRDGLCTISGDQRSGIEISLNPEFVKTDANDVRLRNEYNQYIPKEAPDPQEGNALKPVSADVGARNNTLISSQLYLEAGAWSFNQGFTTFNCYPAFQAPGSLTSGNAAFKRDATPQEEHDAHRRWMVAVEAAGSSWGLR